MERLPNVIFRFIARYIRRRRMLEDGLHINTERTRRQRELACSQNQAGHNLTVQTTIDMARTQTWTGGG